MLLDFGTFDFIVVGAGATGCVVANRLTEVSDWKVLIVEAGDYGNDFADIPAMYDYVHASKYNWGFYSTPQTTACLGELLLFFRLYLSLHFSLPTTNRYIYFGKRLRHPM